MTAISGDGARLRIHWLLSAVAIALFAIVLNTTHTQSAEQWQQKLSAKGWSKIKRKLTDFTDYTWYGQPNQHRSTEGWIYYLTPSGRTGLLRSPKGSIFVDYRQEGPDGRICSLIKELRNGEQHCGNSLWKRGDLYMFANPAGRIVHVWKWKKGNIEGLKLD